MLKLTSKNFKDLKEWKLTSNPFRAIKDFSELKSEQRWKTSNIVENTKKILLEEKIYLQIEMFSTITKKQI